MSIECQLSTDWDVHPVRTLYLSRYPSRLSTEGIDPQSIVNALITHAPIFLLIVPTPLLLFYFRLVIVMELVQMKHV